MGGEVHRANATRASCCWPRRGAATATCRTGSRWRGGGHPKGHYLAYPDDVEGKVPNAPTLAGLPECLALLVPDASQPFAVVLAHAVWLKTWFQERAAIALSLLRPARR